MTVAKRTRAEAKALREQGMRLRRVRQRVGMSQERFAVAINVSSSTVRNWELGRHRPDGPTLVLYRLIDRAPDVVFSALARY